MPSPTLIPFQEALKDALKEMVASVKKFFLPAVDDFRDALKELKQHIADATDAVRPAFKAIKELLTEVAAVVKDKLVVAFEGLRAAFDIIKFTVQGTAATIGGLFTAVLDKVRAPLGVLAAAFGGLAGVFGTVRDLTIGIGETMGSTFKAIADAALASMFGRAKRSPLDPHTSTVREKKQRKDEDAKQEKLDGVANAANAFVSQAISDFVAVANGASIALKAPLSILQAGISAITSEVAGFVKLANLGVFQRFQLAVDDCFASIGRALIPVLEQFTQVIRSIGSAIFGLTGIGTKVIQALAAGAVITGVFAAALVTVGSIVAAGTTGLLAFGGAVAIVQNAISLGTAGIFQVIGGLAGGLVGGLLPVLTAAGAALAGVAFAGSNISSVLKTIQTAFYGLVETLGGVINEVLKTGALQSVMTGLVGTFASIVDVVGKVFAAFAPGIAAVVQIVGKLAEVLAPVLAAIGAAFVPIIAALGALTALSFAPLVAAIAAVGTVVGTVAVAVAVPITAAFYALAKVAEFVAPIVTAVIDELMSVGTEFMSLASDIAGVIEDAIELSGVWSAIKEAVTDLQVVLSAVTHVVGNLVKEVITWIWELFGLTAAPEVKKKGTDADNTGAAARSTSIGSVASGR